MSEYKTHCDKCGTPLTEDEIAYSESGSFLGDPFDLCEYCTDGYKGNVSLNDLDVFFDDVSSLFDDYDED